MANINNEISNPIAGGIWLGIGFLGVAGLTIMLKNVRAHVNIWQYFFGPEPADDKRDIVVRMQRAIWSFFGGWLALYLLLDFAW